MNTGQKSRIQKPEFRLAPMSRTYCLSAAERNSHERTNHPASGPRRHLNTAPAALTGKQATSRGCVIWAGMSGSPASADLSADTQSRGGKKKTCFEVRRCRRIICSVSEEVAVRSGLLKQVPLSCSDLAGIVPIKRVDRSQRNDQQRLHKKNTRMK